MKKTTTPESEAQASAKLEVIEDKPNLNISHPTEEITSFYRDIYNMLTAEIDRLHPLLLKDKHHFGAWYQACDTLYNFRKLLEVRGIGGMHAGY